MSLASHDTNDVWCLLTLEEIQKVGQVSVIEIITTGDNDQTHTMMDHRWSSTVSIRDIETTIFDPPNVFLITHT